MSLEQPHNPVQRLGGSAASALNPLLDFSIDRLDLQDSFRLQGRAIGELSDAELAASREGPGVMPPPESTPVHNPRNWLKLRVQWPQRRVHVHLRVEEAVLNWFRRDGAGFQARMSAVLRAYVDAQVEAERRAK